MPILPLKLSDFYRTNCVRNGYVLHVLTQLLLARLRDFMCVLPNVLHHFGRHRLRLNHVLLLQLVILLAGFWQHVYSLPNERDHAHSGHNQRRILHRSDDLQMPHQLLLDREPRRYRTVPSLPQQQKPCICVCFWLNNTCFVCVSGTDSLPHNDHNCISD